MCMCVYIHTRSLITCLVIYFLHSEALQPSVNTFCDLNDSPTTLYAFVPLLFMRQIICWLITSL